MEDQSEALYNRHTWHTDENAHHTHANYKTAAGKGAVLLPKTGVKKRLFSDTIQSSNIGVAQFEDAENVYDLDPENGASDSARKRQKSSEWFKNDAPARAPLRSRVSGANSPKHPRRTSSIQPSSQPPRQFGHGRTSSFIEGSMNDRVSVPPPASYVAHKDLMNDYEGEQKGTEEGFARTDCGDFIPREDERATPLFFSPTKTEKPSSTMVRFGKNMVSVFNVANWKLFSRSGKETKSEDTNGKKYDMEASQQAYQELKASGNFRDHTTPSARFPRPQSMMPQSANLFPSKQHQVSAEETHEKRDHGVTLPSMGSASSVQEYARSETPRTEKRYGQVYDVSPVRQSRAPSPSSISQSSRASLDNSHRKKGSSLSFKKPNFARQSVSSTDLPLTNAHVVRRMPSKKQIALEQKLVKKISTLEAQLEEARRQLNESVGEPIVMMSMESLNKKLNARPPVEFAAEPIIVSRRRNFVPGALSTLPSERLLVAEDEDAQDYDGEDDLKSMTSQLNSQLNGQNPILPHDHAQRGRSMSKDIQALSNVSNTTITVYEGDERSDSGVSSVHDSEITGDTVIHHRLSSDSVNRPQEVLSSSANDTVETTPKPKNFNTQKVQEKTPEFKIYNDDAENGNNEDTPKAEPVKRKTSAKRKSHGDEDDDDVYKPSNSDLSDDDDAAWEEAATYSTPKKVVSRLVLKKQKISGTNSPVERVRKQTSFESPKDRVKKQTSFDSPKGAFISSTKQPKRASIPISTPPKHASPVNATKRKSMNDFPPPPTSYFNFTSSHQSRPSTPVASKKQSAAPMRPGTPTAGKKQLAAPNRPNSPGGFTSSIPKKTIPIGKAFTNTLGSQEDDSIPPVPKLSEESLKKHKEAAKAKQRRLTAHDIDDIHRHKKAASTAGSSHPNQDIPLESIEKGSTKSTSSVGTTKVKVEKQRNKDDFQWDEDVF